MKTSQAGREGEKVEHPDPDTQLTLSKDQRSDSAGPACQPRGQEIPLVKPNKEKKKKKKARTYTQTQTPQLPNKNINKMSYLKAMTDPSF